MFRRAVIPLTLALALTTTQISGCIGSFALTGKVLDVNRDLGGIVVQEVVFLAFVIVQVYSVTIFADAVVLNLIEAITGDNPLADAGGPDGVRTVDLGGGGVMVVQRQGRRLHTEVVRPGAERVVRDFRLTRKGLEVVDDNGDVVITAEPTLGGGLRVRDADGVPVAEHDTAELWRAQDAWTRGGASALAAVLSTPTGPVYAAAR